MMSRFGRMAVAVGAVVLGLGLASPAFAAEEPVHGTLPLALSISTQGSNYVLTVYNINTGTQNTTLEFLALTQSQYSNFKTNDDGGTPFPNYPYTGGLPYPDFSLPNPMPSGGLKAGSASKPIWGPTAQGWNTTETFTIPESDIPAGTVAISVAQMSPDLTNEWADEAAYPLDGSTAGNLPEVPYAAALPLMGVLVGGAGVLWRRRRPS